MDTSYLKNRIAAVSLTILRVIIGWHFLYEGLVKLLNPAWTARPFLEGSRWIFGDFFRWMISGNTGMSIIDNANAYGLTIIGIALILGVFTRVALWSGIALLVSYYLAYPPFGGYSYGFPSEGS
jgi:thiosulfate dehydrogenase [quinone] large subunit